MNSGEKKIVAALAVILVASLGLYFGMPQKTASAAPMMTAQAGGPPAGPARPQGAGPGAASDPGGCATTGAAGAAGVATFEAGKKGAKVDIIAILPITHGCHVATEGIVKKLAQDHPNDVHLVVVDLFGKDGPKYLKQTGLGQSAAVAINGKTAFKVNGKSVQLLRQEGQSYMPGDIELIVNGLLKEAKS